MRQIWILCLLIKQHRTLKAYRGTEAQSHILHLCSRGEWSSLSPGYFAPRERAPGTLWTEGWLGLRASLDALVKRRICASELHPLFTLLHSPITDLSYPCFIKSNCTEIIYYCDSFINICCYCLKNKICWQLTEYDITPFPVMFLCSDTFMP